MLFHKHLLINAKVNKPMQSENEAIDFLTRLVDKIDMKIIKGPFASYVDKEGNKGLTAIVMIETSHIAFHIWDEVEPGLLQFDLYTCGSLDVNTVFAIMQEAFDIDSLDYVLFDRENGFVIEQQGNIANGVVYTNYPQGFKPSNRMLDPNEGNFFDPKDSHKKI
jgi:S-adenosylmethionine/arginine decarboxylase-like enzyme